MLFKLLLQTKDPGLLVKFYESLGVHFNQICIDSNATYYVASGQPFVITKSQWERDMYDGIICYDVECKNTAVYDKANKLLYQKIGVSKLDYNKFTLKSQHPWIALIKVRDIHSVKDFFSDVGEWKLEKHGNGPHHYSIKNENSYLFEIYPSKERTAVGFLVSNMHGADTMFRDCDGRFIKSGE